MMGMVRLLALGCLAGAVAGQYNPPEGPYTCSNLPDQLKPHGFETTLYGTDNHTAFKGMVQYACNQSSGGVTYIQNLTYKFDFSGGDNLTLDTHGDVFQLDFSAYRRAPGRAAFCPERGKPPPLAATLCALPVSSVEQAESPAR